MQHAHSKINRPPTRGALRPAHGPPTVSQPSHGPTDARPRSPRSPPTVSRAPHGPTAARPRPPTVAHVSCGPTEARPRSPEPPTVRPRQEDDLHRHIHIHTHIHLNKSSSCTARSMGSCMEILYSASRMCSRRVFSPLTCSWNIHVCV